MFAAENVLPEFEQPIPGQSRLGTSSSRENVSRAGVGALKPGSYLSALSVFNKQHLFEENQLPEVIGIVRSHEQGFPEQILSLAVRESFE